MKRKGCGAEKGRKSMTEEGPMIGCLFPKKDTVDPIQDPIGKELQKVCIFSDAVDPAKSKCQKV